MASALGISVSQYSRIERGLSPDCRSAGHACSRSSAWTSRSVRTRAATRSAMPAHAALARAAARAMSPLDRYGGRRSRSRILATCAPGTRLAMCRAFRAGVEAETRLRDLQALDRRLALKERDGGMDRLILLVLDSPREPRRRTCAPRCSWRFGFPSRAPGAGVARCGASTREATRSSCCEAEDVCIGCSTLGWTDVVLPPMCRSRRHRMHVSCRSVPAMYGRAARPGTRCRVPRLERRLGTAGACIGCDRRPRTRHPDGGIDGAARTRTGPGTRPPRTRAGARRAASLDYSR